MEYLVYLIKSSVVLALLFIAYKTAMGLRNPKRVIEEDDDNDENEMVMESKIGIYKIGFSDTDEVFIGQSPDLAASLKYHKEELKAKKHYNKKLQASYNKHGVRKMEFSVLQYCEEDSLDYLERYYLNKFNMIYSGLATRLIDTEDE